MTPRLKDRVKAKVATQVTKRMTRDERIIRVFLGTKPDDVPKRLLLVATPFVLDRAASKLSKVRITGNATIGQYEDVDVGIVNTGMGTPSAAMVMEAVVRTQPIAAVRGELCGGLGKSQKIGEAFLATQAIVGDGCGLTYFGSESTVTAHAGLTEHVVRIAERLKLTTHLGKIWTTDVLLKQTKELLADWIAKGAMAVDMESSAILGIASMEDVPAASLNCISDLPEQGMGPFDMKEVDPNFLTGLDLTLIAALRSVTTWSN